MEYIINSECTEFKIIMFEYGGRKWEICIDIDISEQEIQQHISTRILGLSLELAENGDYDKSNLFEDYTKNNNINGN